MPYLYAACDIYAAPSRLEGFGMPQVEAGACAKPVLSIAAMAMLETLVHGETALLAGVSEENYIQETTLGPEAGFREGQVITFTTPRIADYRADVGDLSRYLEVLMRDPGLRHRLGESGRKRAIECYDTRCSQAFYGDRVTRLESYEAVVRWFLWTIKKRRSKCY
jgi:glycosyltransferase involved in cell wall biosynthesis